MNNGKMNMWQVDCVKKILVALVLQWRRKQPKSCGTDRLKNINLDTLIWYAMATAKHMEKYGTHGVCKTCAKYEIMDKQSLEYKNWLKSKNYATWENDHHNGKTKCSRVNKHAM